MMEPLYRGETVPRIGYGGLSPDGEVVLSAAPPGTPVVVLTEDDYKRLSDVANERERHWLILTETIRVAAADGANTAVEYVADYLNDHSGGLDHEAYGRWSERLDANMSEVRLLHQELRETREALKEARSRAEQCSDGTCEVSAAVAEALREVGGWSEIDGDGTPATVLADHIRDLPHRFAEHDPAQAAQALIANGTLVRTDEGGYQVGPPIDPSDPEYRLVLPTEEDYEGLVSTGNLTEILALSSEIGQAWRGDWGDFDGRTLRDEMNDLHLVASGDMTPERYRVLHGLCPLGRGHWTDYCSQHACDDEEGRTDDGRGSPPSTRKVISFAEDDDPAELLPIGGPPWVRDHPAEAAQALIDAGHLEAVEGAYWHVTHPPLPLDPRELPLYRLVLPTKETT